MNNRKRRYLFQDEPIPRRTEYRRRMRERAEAARRERFASSSDSEEEQVEQQLPIERENGNGLVFSASGSNEETEHDSAHNNFELAEGHSDGNSTNTEVEDNSNDENLSSRSSISNPFLSNYDEDGNDSTDHSTLSGTSSKTAASENFSGQEDIGNYEEPHIEPLVEPVHDQPQRDFQPQLPNPLCPCTTTTEGDVFLMCLALGVRHNLSWIAMVDILKMVNICFSREVVGASKHFLMKYMEVGQEDTTFHHFCEKCSRHLGVRNIQNNDYPQCNCGENDPIIENEKFVPSFYVSVNIQGQLKRLLEKPSLAREILTYRFQRQKVREDAYEDIYDGAAYKQLSQDGGLLSNPLNFSYTFNTDGVKISSSSSQSAWPIFLQINELSPKNRKKYVLLAGMWVGKKDPNMRLFLSTFSEEANRLSSVGVQWVNSEGENVTSKIIPTCFVVDSGARYKLLNMSTFHSYFGCTFCYHRAINTRKGRRYTVPNVPIELRTHESILTDMRAAFDNRNIRNEARRTVRGTKGPSPLITMNYLNLSNAFTVEYMHSALLGNMRSHFSYLMHSVNCKFYIGLPAKLALISERLVSICPPSIITRTPRKLSEAKNFKASEWRSILIFYFYPILNGTLDKKYIAHLALLSAAFNILLQKSCSAAELEMAHQYLLKYVYQTQIHFTSVGMLYNVHLLLHLVKSVYDWGPIHCHNAFVFEGQNFHLVQMLTSPGQVAYQLTRRYLTYNALPSLCEKYASSESSIDFVEELTGKQLKKFLRCGGSVLVGRGVPYNLNLIEENALQALNIAIEGNILSFEKCLSKGMCISTASYSEGKKNNNSYVALNTKARGVVQKIVSVNNTVCLFLKKILVQRQPILKTDDVTITHIQKVLREGDLIAVTPAYVETQCVIMEVESGTYIADVPYGCLSD